MSASRRRTALLAALGVVGALLVAAPPSVADPDGAAFSRLSGFAPAGDRVRVRPKAYAAYRVDLGRVRADLGARSSLAPGGGAASVVELPTPDGDRARFAVSPTQVMEPALAAAHPEIATYAGRSLDTPGATVALDVTPMGLHASVRGPVGTRTWYVDPAYDRRGTTTVLSYYGAAVPARSKAFVEREPRSAVPAARTGAAATQPGGLVTRRSYRLALTSDPSYAAYFGTQNVLAEKVTLVNRVNQVYNDDLAVDLRLVNATDRLNLDTQAKATGANGPCGAHPCFDPPGADPDQSPGQLDFCDVPTLGRNRTVLGQLVGASNYDIGHLALGVNGGGVAFLGVVGGDYKAGGCTGIPTPEGDFYAIDYVAHEMGHQFAGNHTFDGVNGACSGGNRNGPTSVEPGSGSTIMAYAGICGQDDLQPHSDPYFSQRSQQEITTYTSASPYRGIEVQTVSLSGFDTDGDTVVLGYRDRSPVTITRGTNYTRAGIEKALQRLTGQAVSVVQWGFDEFVEAPGQPDDTGFQVIFNRRPTINGTGPDLPSLQVVGTTGGTQAEVGETARGGASQNGGSTVERTTNHAPVVTAPSARTLPLRTPFTLTGSGYDADGDTLTYLWEQNDAGSARGDGTALLDPTRVLGPLFRVFGTAAEVTDEGALQSPSPGENLAPLAPSRTFPDLAQVLADNTNAATGRCPGARPGPDDAVPARTRDCYSELLPMAGYLGDDGSRSPAMHFRLTARDGFPAGGGTAYGDVTLRVDPSAGPFRVSSQGTSARLAPGALVPVRWTVNGTQRLARSVRILLSTDDGQSFDRVLAVTDNDGSADVVLPQLRAAQARLKVEAVDNYFFDVNHASFRIG